MKNNVSNAPARLMPSRLRILNTLFLLMVQWLFASASGWAAPATTPPRVLILDETVSGGAASAEALAAQLAIPGVAVDVVTAANWVSIPGTGLGGPTGFGFDRYRAIVLGDPNCATGTPGYISALNALDITKGTWTPVVTGNVIIMGIDNTLHAGSQIGADKTVKRGVAFAVNDPIKTGLYYAVSCYYDYTAPATVPTVVPHLTGFGTFKTRNYPGTCFNAAHQVATHPLFSATPALTDAELSNWSCSTHEGFDVWPPSFVVLAIALTNGVYTATDGSNGVPYILVRGEGVKVISYITLDPPSATNPVGTTHTVCATLSTNVNPRVGVTVTFNVVSGPNAGTTGTGITGTNGVACFTYTDTGGAGTDYIVASFTTKDGVVNSSATVTKTWKNDCAVFGCETLECVTNGVWRYRFCVTNLTKDTIQYVSFVNLPPGAAVTPNIVAFSPGLPPGGFTNTTVTLTGPAGMTNFCFTLGLHTTNFVRCCSVLHCVELPECCVRVVENKLSFVGSTGPTNFYNYVLTLQNLTANSVHYVMLVPNKPCFKFIPNIVDVTLPIYGGPSEIGPGQTRVLNLQVQITSPCPGPLTFLVATLTSNMVECCSLRVRLPAGAAGLKLETPLDGSLVLENTPVVLLATVKSATPLRAVQFYRNDILLGTVDKAPYILSVRGLVPGDYLFSAAALYTTGESETSEGAMVSVLPHDRHVAAPLGATLVGNTVLITIQPELGERWTIEYSDQAPNGPWIPLESVEGNGEVLKISEPLSGRTQRFYRAVLEAQ